MSTYFHIPNIYQHWLIKLNCIHVSGGAGAALRADDPNAANAADGANAVPVVGMTTVVTSSVLSATVAILVAVAVVMAIRQVRRWRSAKADKNAAPASSGRLPSGARGVDNFGFSTVSSKFSAGRPALPMDDDSDTISASTVDMNF